MLGSRVGRFVLGELIGRGGMGRVHRAYDPALDRDVAVKLLARNRAPDAQARFRREAQAMALVSHPNVLPIFDVGDVEFGSGERGSFIAMELVEGQTLRTWLRQRPRSHAEILEVFIRAGRGLTAVHALGLLHRDFKPTNVMVGLDGRVRVMDFGLARASGSLDAEVRDPAAKSRRLEVWVTRSGVRGTPAYMAPEQYRGEPLDERCDQYSYCVALWEALHGTRPFVGADAEALMEAKQTMSPIRSPDTSVPPWLDRLLCQGLAADPSERHPSMAALVRQLEGGGRRRGRWGRWVVGSMVLGTVAVLMSMGPSADTTERPCQGAGKLAGVWDVERRAQARASILGTGLPHASRTWQRIGPQLDDYAARWSAAHDRACAEAKSTQARAEELLDGRMRCLDTRLGHLEAFAEILVTRNPATIDDGLAGADRLPSLEPCADDDYVLGLAPLPPDSDHQRELAALELDLARVRAREYAGDYAEARTLIERALPQAESLGYAPLEAEATLLMGWLYERSVQHSEAAQMLERAYFSAAALELSAIQAEAAVHLVFINAVRQEHYAEALEWAAHARSVLETLDDDYLQAQLLDNLGTAHKEYEHPVLAIEAYERALSILERELGPAHPQVASTLAHLGTVHFSQGRLDDALASYRRALRINERALGPLHPRVGLALHGLGNVYEERGEFERALEYYERAWAISERTHGPAGTANLSITLCLASVHASLGRFDRAFEYYERALSFIRESSGPDSIDEIETFYEMGLVHERRGDLDEAEEHFAHAVSASDRTERSKEPIVVASLTSLGRVQHAQHRSGDARATLERAVSIVVANEDVPLRDRAAARFGLARVLAESGADAERAHALASTARDEYETAQGDHASAIAELTAWLDARVP